MPNPPSRTRAVLVNNAGSSSIKFALFSCPRVVAHTPGLRELPRSPLSAGEIVGIGSAPSILFAGDRAPRALPKTGANPYRAAFAPILEWLDGWRRDIDLVAVAHRVVHGGVRYSAPMLVTEAAFDDLRTLIPLAPLHQTHNVDAIEWLRRALPGIPQVAVFDTAFHRTLPRCEQLLPLPIEWFEAGVRRYGFHGLSYDYLSTVIAERFGDAARGRVIMAHLGSGASLCALKDLCSVATTMGFSALDGLMMGTRCGALDPGVVLHMMEVRGMSHRDLATLLYHESGLKGISGLSDDPRELLEREAQDMRARDALALYVHRIVREIGGLVAILGGLDMLVFSAGVGEHCAPVRERVCAALAWLGVRLDSAANNANRQTISTNDSRINVMVEPTNEAWVAARGALEVLDFSNDTTA
jgi:acetate kinase